MCGRVGWRDGEKVSLSKGEERNGRLDGALALILFLPENWKTIDLINRARGSPLFGNSFLLAAL